MIENEFLRSMSGMTLRFLHLEEGTDRNEWVRKKFKAQGNEVGVKRKKGEVDMGTRKV